MKIRDEDKQGSRMMQKQVQRLYDEKRKEIGGSFSFEIDGMKLIGNS